jgi:hypothetical protein
VLENEDEDKEKKVKMDSQDFGISLKVQTSESLT